MERKSRQILRKKVKSQRDSSKDQKGVSCSNLRNEMFSSGTIAKKKLEPNKKKYGGYTSNANANIMLTIFEQTFEIGQSEGSIEKKVQYQQKS